MSSDEAGRGESRPERRVGGLTQMLRLRLPSSRTLDDSTSRVAPSLCVSDGE